MSSISNSLSSSYLQSIFSALQNTVASAGTTAGTSSIAQQPDSSQLSPFAQLVSILQQLQQSDPTKYKQVTQQIAANLQSAAQAATQDGNSAAANQLTQLATDFSNASQTGQLPNGEDLAQAVGGGGGHRHHHHGASASSSDSSSGSSLNGTSSSTTSTNNSQTLSQLFSAPDANGAQSSGQQNNSLNPFLIIQNTLTMPELPVVPTVN